MSAWYAYKKDHSTRGLKATDVSKEEDPAEIGALMSKKDKALQKSVDKALDKLRKDGKLKEISKICRWRYYKITNLVKALVRAIDKGFFVIRNGSLKKLDRSYFSKGSSQ